MRRPCRRRFHPAGHKAYRAYADRDRRGCADLLTSGRSECRGRSTPAGIMVALDASAADALGLDPDEVGEDAEDLFGEDDGYEWVER